MKSYVELFKKRYKCKETVWIPHGTWDVNPRTRIPHNPQTILYFGHSGPYKDLDLLFKTFEIVTTRKSTVRLVVAGASHPNYPHFLDSYRSRNSPSNVQFTGYIPEDELQSFFTHIDVVVLPYHTCTGTSGVAHLASSYGLPIVATDLPEFRELIEEGCKIMLSPHDPFALAKKIEYVLDNPNLMLELGKQSLVFARGRTWERIAVLFRDLYKQLTSNSARQPKPLSLNRTWLSFRPFISTSKEKYQGASSLGSETGEA
jgi:glycosyltransferase involved in cell wall biosynthesis